jgi:hypothetical protein
LAGLQALGGSPIFGTVAIKAGVYREAAEQYGRNGVNAGQPVFIRY